MNGPSHHTGVNADDLVSTGVGGTSQLLLMLQGQV